MKNESPQRVDEVSRQRGYGEKFDDAAKELRERVEDSASSAADPEIGEDGLLASDKDERSPNVPGYADSDHGAMPSQAEAETPEPDSEILKDAYSVNDPGVETKE